MSSNKLPWYVEFFGDDYRAAYRSTLTDERSDARDGFRGVDPWPVSLVRKSSIFAAGTAGTRSGWQRPG